MSERERRSLINMNADFTTTLPRSPRAPRKKRCLFGRRVTFSFFIGMMGGCLVQLGLSSLHREGKVECEELQLAANRKYPPLPKVSRIILLGERNSGTNYVEMNLFRAFAKYQGKMESSFFSMKLPVVFTKHMLRHSLLTEMEIQKFSIATMNTVFLFVVRAPFDWADAMKRKPWHMCPLTVSDEECREIPYIGLNKNVTEDLTREEFLRMPFRDWAEIDRGEDEFIYDNIFELRKHKLMLMEQIRDAVGPDRVKVVHLHDVEAAPSRFILEVAQDFGLDIAEDYVPPEPTEHHHLHECYDESEYEFSHNAIDWDLEARFRGIPGDSRRCVN